MTHDIAPFYGPTPSQKRPGIARILRNYTVLPAIYAFIHEWNEPYGLYLPLPSQLKLVLIYLSRSTSSLEYKQNQSEQ